ncbi:hypothetical protein HBI79_156240 [Parastagonospora nodorum]|nr:hypothetical protein HBI79_156240 [Parastagonospora nodorum]KAH5441344.1 hypothetical protein HBI47_044280 [Parastagonospora nodorum]
MTQLCPAMRKSMVLEAWKALNSVSRSCARNSLCFPMHFSVKLLRPMRPVPQAPRFKRHPVLKRELKFVVHGVVQ